MDHLTQPLVAERALDVGGLDAADLAQLGGVIVDQPPREVAALRFGERHHLARLEVPGDVHEARRQEALAPFS